MEPQSTWRDQDCKLSNTSSMHIQLHMDLLATWSVLLAAEPSISTGLVMTPIGGA